MDQPPIVHEWHPVAPGVKRKVQQDGEHLMLVQVTLEKGSVVPEHQHRHEQITFVVTGHIQATIPGKVVDLRPGDSIRFPSNVPHRVTAIEETLVMDVFSPPREDFRP